VQPIEKLLKVVSKEKWICKIDFSVWGRNVHAKLYFACREDGFSNHTAQNMIKAHHFPRDAVMFSGYFTEEISGCNQPNIGYSTGLHDVPYKTKDMLNFFRGKRDTLKSEVLKYEEYLKIKDLNGKILKESPWTDTQ